MNPQETQANIRKLRQVRDELWEKFQSLPKKGCFAGLAIAEKLDQVQQMLDKLEGDHPSERYHAVIHIDAG